MTKTKLIIPLIFIMASCSENAIYNSQLDGSNSTDGAVTNDDTESAPDDITRTDGGTFSDTFDECTAVNEMAQNTRGPADVIIAIDNTTSMYNEIEEVRNNMNRFSEMITAEGLDLRIVLISCLTPDCLTNDRWHTICIAPPLGTEDACQPDGNHTDDSNLPDYLHVNSRVESRKGLESIIDTQPEWVSVIRDNSAKHIVIISDDDDDWTAQQFYDQLTSLDDRFVDFQFHGIFAYLDKDEACAISEQDPCCEFAAPDGEGTVYKDLVQMTEGKSGNLCLQEFDPVFDEFANAVVASAKLNCEWVIPEPPDGQELDPTKVNVLYSDGENDTFMFGRVESADQCDQVEHAWYYDNPDEPTMILICPQTCDWIQGQIGSRIDVQFGCESIWEPQL
jgi:hypothetical protein